MINVANGSSILSDGLCIKHFVHSSKCIFILASNYNNICILSKELFCDKQKRSRVTSVAASQEILCNDCNWTGAEQQIIIESKLGFLKEQSLCEVCLPQVQVVHDLCTAVFNDEENKYEDVADEAVEWKEAASTGVPTSVGEGTVSKVKPLSCRLAAAYLSSRQVFYSFPWVVAADVIYSFVY